MRQKTGPQTSAVEKTIKDIRRATRKHHSAEGKIRVVDPADYPGHSRHLPRAWGTK